MSTKRIVIVLRAKTLIHRMPWAEGPLDPQDARVRHRKSAVLGVDFKGMG